MADPSSVQTASLYEPNIPETSNVRFSENRIIINASHTDVFNFVTTWSNLPRWLPVAESTIVQKGTPDAPTQMGDVLFEAIKDKSRKSKVYTVVARVPGLLWVVSGVDEGDMRVARTVTFMTSPLADGTTLFCRVFQDVRDESKELTVERHPVCQPAVIQKGLERLKEEVEGEARK